MHDGIRLSIKDGESLLDTLLRRGVSLPHECEGTVVCASCRVVVREGLESLSPVTDDEQGLLDGTASSEPAARLACQVTAGRDLLIEIPQPESMRVRELTRAPVLPIAVTERAANHLTKQLTKRAGSKAVRIAVRSSGCSGLRYVVEYADAIGPGDAVSASNGLHMVVDAESLPHLTGMTVDIEKEGLSRRLRFENPNVKQTCGCGESFAT